MKKPIWYKNWIWYYHLILFIVFLCFLIWGLYLCCFKEFWYVKKGWNKRFLNYDALMSFFSVQVNIMTIVWLIFYLSNINNKTYGVNSPRFRLTMMNLNLIVFFVFWLGIIYFSYTDEMFLNQYTISQIICTVVTHFICPLSLIIIYFFVSGENYYSYLDVWKHSDIYIAYIYSLFYLFYVYIRGLMYSKDGNWYVQSWPYPFLNFDNLFVGKSVVGYMILVIVVFGIWIAAHHYLLIFVNNLIYNFRNQKLNKYLNKEKLWK